MNSRITLALTGLVVGSLSLSACGTTVKQTLHGAMHSVGAQPYVQMHLTASLSGTGANAASAARDEAVLAKLSYDVKEASANGGAIADASGKVNSDITINVSGTPLLHLIEIDKTIYVNIDFNVLSAFPQLGSSFTHELPVAQLTYGNRWFEVPSSLLTSYLPSSTKAAAESTSQIEAETKIIDAITAVIEKGTYTSTGNGYQETGTLDALARGLAPAVAALEHKASVPVGHTPGTYHVSLGLDGTTATSVSVGITAPNKSGKMTVALQASISHHTDAITAPTAPTVITRQLLQGLGLGGH